MGHKTCALFSQPYLDPYLKCYKNIITINDMPEGPLTNIVQRVKMNPLSPYKVPGPCTPIKKCDLALRSIGNDINCSGCCKNDLMTPEEIPGLFSYLMMNGYKIDTSITKMMQNSSVNINPENQMLCFITYMN